MSCSLLLRVFYLRAFSGLMVSSGSSLESTRPHSRRDLRRSSRSRDTRPQMDEPDYDDDEGTPLPSINPPPGTAIARGVPDPPPHSDPTAGDTSRMTRSPLARHHDRRRSPRSRSAHSRRRRGHRRRSRAASRSRRGDRRSRRSHSRRRRSRTHQRGPQEHRDRPREPYRQEADHTTAPHGTPVSPPASVHAPSDRDSSVATPLRLLPGPGVRPPPLPTPPDTTPRPTTPPQAFQPPPVIPLTTLPVSEQEELRQLRLQFQQQQQAAHHLQQQAFLHSSFNPFFPPTSSFFPRPPSRLHLPNHPPFLHPPTPPPPLQHQYPRSRNPPISLFPFSPLQRPPNLQHPIKPFPLLIAQLVQ